MLTLMQLLDLQYCHTYRDHFTESADRISQRIGLSRITEPPQDSAFCYFTVNGGTPE